MKIELKQTRFPGFIFLLLLGLSIAGHAQTNATVTGIVQDEAGAVLPAITITAVNEASSTGQKSTITNEQEVFTFNQLIAGANYRFTISHLGYQQQLILQLQCKSGRKRCSRTAGRKLLLVTNFPRERNNGCSATSVDKFMERARPTNHYQ